MGGVESAAEFFDRTAATFAAKYRDSAEFTERRLVWRRAIERHLPRVGDRPYCLDLGCGDGSISRFLAERGFKTVGIDQSEVMLGLARRKAVEDRVNDAVEYLQGALPLAPALEANFVNS